MKDSLTVNPFQVIQTIEEALAVYHSPALENEVTTQGILRLPDEFDGSLSGAYIGYSMRRVRDGYEYPVGVEVAGQVYRVPPEHNLTIVYNPERLAEEMGEFVEREGCLDITVHEPIMNRVLLPLQEVANILSDIETLDDEGRVTSTVDRLLEEVAEYAPAFV